MASNSVRTSVRIVLQREKIMGHHPQITNSIEFIVLVKKNKVVDFYQFKTSSDALDFGKLVSRAAEVTNVEVTKVTTQKMVERIR